jgi:hypothetical protein
VGDATTQPDNAQKIYSSLNVHYAANKPSGALYGCPVEGGLSWHSMAHAMAAARLTHTLCHSAGCAQPAARTTRSAAAPRQRLPPVAATVSDSDQSQTSFESASSVKKQGGAESVGGDARPARVRWCAEAGADTRFTLSSS